MSQQKVDRYKEEKANRKQNMKKEKRMRVIRSVTAAVVCAAALGWIGYYGYQSYAENKTYEKAEVDYTSVSDYVNELYAEK